jgi:hypothetical protein
MPLFTVTMKAGRAADEKNAISYVWLSAVMAVSESI